MIQGINYGDVMTLGFKRINEEDSVFYDQNGYDWFRTELKVSKTIYFDWDSETHMVCMIRHIKGDVKNRLYINDLGILRTLVLFFTENEPDSLTGFWGEFKF